jgi:hypothetical protein
MACRGGSGRYLGPTAVSQGLVPEGSERGKRGEASEGLGEGVQGGPECRIGGAFSELPYCQECFVISMFGTGPQNTSQRFTNTNVRDGTGSPLQPCHSFGTRYRQSLRSHHRAHAQPTPAHAAV